MMEELGEAAVTLPEPVLLFGKQVVGFKVVNKLLAHYPFEDLYDMGS